jgi:hypothetical protein
MADDRAARNFEDAGAILSDDLNTGFALCGNTLVIGFTLFFVSILVAMGFTFFLAPMVYDANRDFQSQFITKSCAVCNLIPVEGPQGKTGTCPVCEDGKPGNDGKDGKDGENAVCVPNPMFPCAKGEPGEDGKDGKNGTCTPCVDGTDGEDGVCAQPCVDGKNGTDGQKGEPGNDGTNGTCTCSEVPIQNFTFIGPTATCLVPFPPECFGFDVNACPNFAGCDLIAKSLGLDDPAGGFLQVGSPANIFSRSVHGKRTGMGNYLITLFQTYASQALIEAQNLLRLHSDIDILINAGNNIDTTAAGSTTHTAQSTSTWTSIGGNLVFQVLSLLQTFTVNAQGGVNLNGPTTITHPKLLVTRGGPQKWVETFEGSSFVCDAPADATRDSVRVYEDVVAERVVSPTGTLKLGPDVQFCKGVNIGDLAVLNDVDIKGAIFNSMGKVTFNDTDGVNLYGDTALCNTAPGEPVKVDDDLKVANDAWIMGTLHVGPFINMTTNATSSVTLTGDGALMGITSINGVPIMPPYDASDPFVKTDVRDEDPFASLGRLTALDPKSYVHTKEYQMTDKWVGDKRHRGIMAPDLLKDFDHIVHRVNMTIGNARREIMRVNYGAMMPDAIGAIKALHRIGTKIGKTVRTLSDKLHAAQSKHAQASDRIAALEQRLEQLEKKKL